MLELKEYLDLAGRSPFQRWMDGLNAPAAAKVTTALYRLEQGNLSEVKGVGEGVLERRVNFGPGYRVYFGRDGDRLVILLGGGDKTSQQNDITAARTRWREYKQRKRT